MTDNMLQKEDKNLLDSQGKDVVLERGRKQFEALFTEHKRKMDAIISAFIESCKRAK